MAVVGTRHILPLLGLSSLGLSLAAQDVRLSITEQDLALTRQVQAQEVLGRGLDSRHTLKVRTELAEASGRVHTRMQQYFQGLRVMGGELVLRQDATGTLEATADHLVRNLNLRVDADVAPDAALAIAHQVLAPKAPPRTVPAAERVIVPITHLEPKAGILNPSNAEDFEVVLDRVELAYHVHLEVEDDADTRHEDVLIHAQTGEVLKRWSTLHDASAKGTGRSEYSGTVSLWASTATGGFALLDPTRNNLATYNLNGATSGNGTLYVTAANTWGDGTNYVPAQGSNSANGQTAAVDAHYGMTVTWDMLKNVFGRNGLDGTGRTPVCRVHYGSAYDNAFWSDSSFSLTFGDGKMFKVLTCLDVAAHEMAHGLCSATANLAYYGESGGLNEANSDIFGAMAEFYARGAAAAGTVIPDTGGNWTVGEQLVTPSFPTPLRYMYKPSLDGRSPDAWSSTLGNLDVHFSSGPMNRAFYYLSQGASALATDNTYSTYLKAGMKGIGNDKAARVWFRTLTTRLTSTSTYLDARNGAIAAAKELYGAGSAAEQAAWNAFAAINVGSPWTPPDTQAPTVTVKATGTSATVTFTATPTDNVGVSRVDYLVDGVVKGSATATPWTLAFDSKSVANGNHTLVAKAYDAAGNVGTSANVTFSVTNVKDTQAPTVVAKVTGTSGTLSFSATATDNIGVTRVDYLVDGAIKGSTTAAPWALAFDSTPVANGSHSLVAKAYDAAGNVGTSATLAFSINNVKDTQAPTVTPKVTGTAGTLTFTATATDNVGVTRVDYLVDGVIKGSTTASPWTLAFDSTPVTNGAHGLVAKAYDAAGNVGTSATLSFTVANVAPAGTFVEIESNNTAATANVVAESFTTVKGTLSSATDLDTFAIALPAGKTTRITLNVPTGMLYGLRLLGTQGALPLAAPAPLTGSAADRRTVTQRTVVFEAPANTAVQPAAVLQVYSMDGRVSATAYTLSISR